MKLNTFHFVYLVCICLLGFFSSCDKTTGKPDMVTDLDTSAIVGEQSFQQERDTLSARLKRMQHDITLKMEEIDAKMATADDVSKEKLKKAREALEQQQIQLQKGVAELEVATDETWEEIKKNTNAMLTEVETSFDKAMFEINELFNDKT